MKRRQFLLMIGATPLAVAVFERVGATRQDKLMPGGSLKEVRENWKAFLPGNADVSLSTRPIRKSEEKWKKLLNEAQFQVLRQEGTERPFSSPLNDEKRAGIYVCAGCSLPLFTSEMKFDSGTGWPSFFTSVPDHLGTKRDFKLIWPRTEYHCIRCKGHQGHVFDDGPPPTGERWCNNGVALQFIPL